MHFVKHIRNFTVMELYVYTDENIDEINFISNMQADCSIDFCCAQKYCISFEKARMRSQHCTKTPFYLQLSV